MAVCMCSKGHSWEAESWEIEGKAILCVYSREGGGGGEEGMDYCLIGSGSCCLHSGASFTGFQQSWIIWSPVQAKQAHQICCWYPCLLGYKWTQDGVSSAAHPPLQGKKSLPCCFCLSIVQWKVLCLYLAITIMLPSRPVTRQGYNLNGSTEPHFWMRGLGSGVWPYGSEPCST